MIDVVSVNRVLLGFVFVLCIFRNTMRVIFLPFCSHKYQLPFDLC